ncbi:MAG: MerR family transcriptional regulator [Planktotalea sp.]|uniref:MerR family transcriptional regulator n=1 Tax=Planktotalea sp. TaxID=2029877 RepID=UPI003C74634E
MPKSKDAFRTISEVAEWLETPAHVLRFWESKFTQVKPVKRAGGRRYYRPADMLLLGGIKKLLHDDGLTIKGAQKLLREHGVKHVVDLSQPLDDDLIDEDQIEEAAYEHDAQPEPFAEEPATVLSFPSRAETPEITAPVAAAPTSETAAPPAPSEPLIESTPVADAAAPIASPDVAEESAPSETPAFGSDALPAFLRRSPAPAPKHESQAADAKEPSAPEAPAEKVTINPDAYLEPIESAAADEIASVGDEPEHGAADDSPAEQSAPMFSHRTAEAAGESDAPAETRATAPSVTAQERDENLPAATKPLIDVPSIAKIAPELSSFDAAPGVLAALPGARRLSPELAQQLGSKLAELRSLRDRMQSH